jgi:hypothetical protein
MFVELELRIATFAETDSWQRRLYDAELAGVHDRSLSHRQGRGIESVEIKMHPYRV